MKLSDVEAFIHFVIFGSFIVLSLLSFQNYLLGRPFPSESLWLFFGAIFYLFAALFLKWGFHEYGN